jgi:hypothetical protein
MTAAGPPDGVRVDRVAPTPPAHALGAAVRAVRRAERERQDNVIRWMRRFATSRPGAAHPNRPRA